MDKKTKIIIGIVVVIINVLAVMLIPKVESLNDGGTKTYKALAYEVTKLHKINETSPNEYIEGTSVKIFGKEVYNDIPKETKVIEEGKEIAYSYNKTVDNVSIELTIPNEWKYEELPADVEYGRYNYALKISKEKGNGSAVLYLYNSIFGVCGTGLKSEQYYLYGYNGTKCSVGYYDGSDTWDFISFSELNRNIAIKNEGLNKKDADEFIEIARTIIINTQEADVTLSLKEGTLTQEGATFIIKNNSEYNYNYGSAYEIEVKKEGQWKSIELKEPLTWTEIAFILKAKESNEINIDFNYGYGELSKGEYRLVKTVNKEQIDPRGTVQTKIIYAEFEIK